MRIPEKGASRQQVLDTLKEYRKADVADWREGKVFGFVFHANEEATQVTEDAFRMFMWENALDPTLFRSLLRLETEIVAMAANHLGGDDEVVGSFTSGGTESCMLAVKTARDWARANLPHVKQPEMIIPVTAHAAFQKAAHYLDVKAVVVPVNTETFKVDAETVKNAMNENTILIVGSATSFSHGVVDPIRELAALAQEKGILMHTDGCIGGFMLPLFKKLGGKVTDFDFSVPGVTSISMDLHKYAFAAKGASVILSKNKELREHQIFACSNWTGYTIINPTIQSTKSGGPLGGAWAVMQFMGEDGFLEVAGKLKAAAEKFKAGVNSIPGLRVLGEPEMSLIAVGSDEFSIFEFCDEMAVRGWHIQPQPAVMGVKENFHVTIMPQNVPNIDKMIEDMREAADVVRARKPSDELEQIKAFAQTLSAESITEEGLNSLLAMAGLGSVGIPDRMADINEILNVLPRDVADKLLKGFYNELSRYRKG